VRMGAVVVEDQMNLAALRHRAIRRLTAETRGFYADAARSTRDAWLAQRALSRVYAVFAFSTTQKRFPSGSSNTTKSASGGYFHG
jgi:hypothetical protein